MPLRDELFLVLREAVLNAVRHSGGRRITVVVSVSGGRVQAEVADDGRGLPDDAARGTGLSSMQERVAILGGTLTVAGGPRAGTRVKVQVPLRRGA
jgi:signal transduction histidine kinase